MTNPDNAVGTNAAYAGRTSVNAFNDDLAVYSRGVMTGWACSPNSGMTVALGGDGSTRDVAVAEDNAGNKTTINNISGAPVSVTIGAAPANNSRIDAIVAYVDNPPQGSATIADNYEACGLIAVSGAASSSPVEPSEGAIRSAITADGASGATAYYVVLATVTVASGTTDITADVITPGANATIQPQNMNLPTPPVVMGSFSNTFQSRKDSGYTLVTLDISSFPTGYKMKFIGTGFWVNRGTNVWSGRSYIRVGTASSTQCWTTIPANSGSNEAFSNCLVVEKQDDVNTATFMIAGSGTVDYSNVEGQAQFMAF